MQTEIRTVSAWSLTPPQLPEFCPAALSALSRTFDFAHWKSRLPNISPHKNADAAKHSGLQPIRQRFADLFTGVFLDEMDSWHGDFRLVRPTAAEFALFANQYCTRFGVNEQFWQVGRA